MRDRGGLAGSELAAFFAAAARVALRVLRVLRALRVLRVLRTLTGLVGSPALLSLRERRARLLRRRVVVAVATGSSVPLSVVSALERRDRRTGIVRAGRQQHLCKRGGAGRRVLTRRNGPASTTATIRDRIITKNLKTRVPTRPPTTPRVSRAITTGVEDSRLRFTNSRKLVE